MNAMFALMNMGAMMADYKDKLSGEWAWVGTVLDAIDLVLFPALLIVASIGTIYAIIIGITMAKADSTEKREEAKKRLINVLIGIAITIALILLFKLLPTILDNFGLFGTAEGTGN